MKTWLNRSELPRPALSRGPTVIGPKPSADMERVLGIMSFGFSSDASAVLAAMSKSQAIIEFDLTGKILSANPNFCAALGYELTEIVGQHHRLFVDPAEASSAEYRQFWTDLAAGKFDQRQYKRIGKGGKEIWIEASYNPVFKGGKPYKVVKFATDITAQKLKSAEDAGKLDALSRAQACGEKRASGRSRTKVRAPFWTKWWPSAASFLRRAAIPPGNLALSSPPAFSVRQ